MSQYFLYFMLLSALCLIAQAWMSQSRTQTIHPFKAFVHLLAFYCAYLLIPLFFFSLYSLYVGDYSPAQGGFIAVLCGLLIYARFIEPHCIRLQHTRYALYPERALQRPVKIALIADLHIGLFSGHERQLKQIVKKINQAAPDFVVVAGDWTYEPEHTLADELAVLQQITVPIYSVNGNHDEQYPGPPIQDLLRDALRMNGVIDIEDQMLEFDEFRLLGIGDLWAGKTDMRELPHLPQDKAWLILSHNPDTVEMVPALAYRALMLSGHTHGGQVQLPWLTDYVMKKVSILGHKKGLYHHAHADVFVTVGTGMVGVPLRFGVPPTVDLIELV